MFTTELEKYEIILMDVHMPEVDGLEAARYVKASEIEVIFIERLCHYVDILYIMM